MEYVLPLAPPMLLVLRLHWYVKGGVPVAATLKPAGAPLHAARGDGCVPVPGAVHVTGGSHVAGCWVMNTSEKARMFPVSTCALSTACRIQVPLGDSPLTAESGELGVKVPDQGLPAAVI